MFRLFYPELKFYSLIVSTPNGKPVLFGGHSNGEMVPVNKDGWTQTGYIWDVDETDVLHEKDGWITLNNDTPIEETPDHWGYFRAVFYNDLILIIHNDDVTAYDRKTLTRTTFVKETWWNKRWNKHLKKVVKYKGAWHVIIRGFLVVYPMVACSIVEIVDFDNIVSNYILPNLDEYPTKIVFI